MRCTSIGRSISLRNASIMLAPNVRFGTKRPSMTSTCSQSAPPARTWPTCSASRVDRKSTRLNSSHGYISYAVFCLKKKKDTHSKLDNKHLRTKCVTLKVCERIDPLQNPIDVHLVERGS